MPDPVPAAPAPAAAAPPPPVPPPQPAPPPSSEPSKPSELASRLFNLLTAPSPGLDDPPKPKEKPADTPPPEPAKDKKEAPPPEDGGIKRRTKAKEPAPEDKPPPIPKRGDVKPADTPPAPTPPKAEPTDADFEKELVDEERAQLDDARAAEKYLGDKYKGYGGKMTAFLKENAKKADAVESGDLERDDYEKWHKANLPRISVLDQRRLTEERVEARLNEKFEPKIAEERHERWVDTEAPKIKAKGNEIYNKLANSALPDDVSAALAERTKGITDRQEYLKKIDEVQRDYAMEFEIAEKVIGIATADIEEFHRISTVNPVTHRPIVAFNPASDQHQRLVKMVTELCDEFKADGGDGLKQNGKWFVTREEWQQMAPEQRAPFWTFTNEQLIERALVKVKSAVANVVTQERDRLEKRYGYKRTIAPPVAAAPTPPPERMPGFGAPPAPRSAPVAPGGGPTPTLGASLASKLTSQPAQI